MPSAKTLINVLAGVLIAVTMGVGAAGLIAGSGPAGSATRSAQAPPRTAGKPSLSTTTTTAPPATVTVGAWSKVPGSAGSPPARFGAVAVFDPTLGGVLVMGGAPTSTPSVHTALSTAWLFNGSWEKVTLTNPPPGDVLGSAAWDPATKQVVLFGGLNGSGTATGATWVLTQKSWTKVAGGTTSAPQARSRAVMAYDPELHEVVLTGGGGVGWTSAVTAIFSTTWVWNGSAWSQLPVAHFSDSIPAGAAMAYDPVAGNLVRLGGEFFAATRRIPHGTVQSFVLARTGAGWKWAALGAPTQGIGEAISGEVLVWDPGARALVAFGGQLTVVNATTKVIGTTTVARTVGVWSGATRHGAQPPARMDASMIWDPELHEAVLFGGRGGLGKSAPVLGTTWLLRHSR